MKLYTEEQVVEAIDKAMSIWLLAECSKEEIFNSLTPIELPSDLDEEKAAISKTKNANQHIGFNMGVEWMREQILNQNK